MIHLQVLSPEKKIYEGNVSKIKLPGTLGAFTILPHHAPLVTSLNKGIVAFTTNPIGNTNESEEHFFSIISGFVEVIHDNVTLCIEIEEKQ